MYFHYLLIELVYRKGSLFSMPILHKYFTDSYACCTTAQNSYILSLSSVVSGSIFLNILTIKNAFEYATNEAPPKKQSGNHFKSNHNKSAGIKANINISMVLGNDDTLNKNAFNIVFLIVLSNLARSGNTYKVIIAIVNASIHTITKMTFAYICVLLARRYALSPKTPATDKIISQINVACLKLLLNALKKSLVT